MPEHLLQVVAVGSAACRPDHQARQDHRALPVDLVRQAHRGPPAHPDRLAASGSCSGAALRVPCLAARSRRAVTVAPQPEAVAAEEVAPEAVASSPQAGAGAAAMREAAAVAIPGATARPLPEVRLLAAMAVARSEEAAEAELLAAP